MNAVRVREFEFEFIAMMNEQGNMQYDDYEIKIDE